MPPALEPAAHVAQPEAPSLSEREPNLARFGLRQLFIFVSVATVLVAVLARMGGVWPIVVGALAALAAAHVFGTFLGTRLRDTSRDVQRWKARPGSSDPDHPVALPQPVCVADLQLPSPSLASYEQIVPARRWPLTAGAVAGLALGAVGIYAAAGDGVTWPGMTLGAVSCGVIGSWIALLGANFYAIASHTLRQANSELARDQAHR